MTIRPIFNSPSPTPRVTLMEVCWHLCGPDRRRLVCALHRSGDAVEVHVGHIDEDPLHVSTHADVSRARDWADDLRAQLLDEGGCEHTDTGC